MADLPAPCPRARHRGFADQTATGPRRAARPLASNAACSAASSLRVNGRNATSPRTRRNTGSPSTRSERNFSWTSVRVRTLLVGVVGQRPRRPGRSAGCHLGLRSGWASSHAANRRGRRWTPSRRTSASHDLVARVGVGHAVDRRQHDVGMAAHDGLDRAPPGSSRRRPGASPRSGRRSRPSRRRRRSRGRRSSTTRCAWSGHRLVVAVVALERARRPTC